MDNCVSCCYNGVSTGVVLSYAERDIKQRIPTDILCFNMVRSLLWVKGRLLEVRKPLSFRILRISLIVLPSEYSLYFFLNGIDDGYRQHLGNGPRIAV